jgi:hypothetical protein
VQQQFEHWRALKRPGERIPQRLWNVATRLAGAHGIHRVACWLRLNATSLRDRADRRSRTHPSPHAPTFLEGALPAGSLLGAPTTEYAVELEYPASATLRIRVRGATVAEVVALAQALHPCVGRR